MTRDRETYNILIIEDNPGDQFIIEEYLLEKIRLPLITFCKNLFEAKNEIEKSATAYDVVLLDLSLPDGSGFDLIKIVLELTPISAVIVLTGNSEIELGTKSISLGVSDYLNKDELTPQILHKSITYSIERKKVNQELRDSEKRFTDLFMQSPNPQWVYNAELKKIKLVNIAATALYGYDRNEFLELDLRPLYRRQ